MFDKKNKLKKYMYVQKKKVQKEYRRQEHIKKLNDRYLLKMLLNRNVHCSFHRKYIKKEFKPYLHSFFNDYGKINLKKTIFQIRTASHLLFQMARNRGKVVIVDSSFVTFYDLEKIITFREIKFLKRSRWIPGMLSNQKHIKNAMSHYISKRFAKKDKKYFFESMVHNLGSIDLLIVTDPLSSVELMNEASNVGVPIIGLVDLNGSFSNIDYPIVCNNQTRQSLFFILQILEQAYKKGHETYSFQHHTNVKKYVKDFIQNTKVFKRK